MNCDCVFSDNDSVITLSAEPCVIEFLKIIQHIARSLERSSVLTFCSSVAYGFGFAPRFKL